MSELWLVFSFAFLLGVAIGFLVAIIFGGGKPSSISIQISQNESNDAHSHDWHEADHFGDDDEDGDDWRKTGNH